MAMVLSHDAYASERTFFDALDLDRRDLRGVRKAVDKEDWEAAKFEWAKHLTLRTTPEWIWSHRDKRQIIDYLKLHKNDLEGSVERAEKVLLRKFHFQGIPRTLNKDIVWWSKEYEFQWINVLHRHLYWKDLGMAWWLTGDSRYAEDWVYMLKAWIKDNPPISHGSPNPRDRQGQPWRKLETGIRTGVWIETMNFFMDAPAFDAETKFLFSCSLLDHANRLVASSEHFRPGNWHQVGVTGLFNLGIMFPEFKDAPTWREMAFQHLQMIMDKGVHPDGAQSELTPGYHRWMTMSWLNSQLLARKNGFTFTGIAERHEKMFDYLMHLSKPDRRQVAVGDARQEHIGEMMGIGALTYGRPDMKYLAIDEVKPDWIWMFSPDELAAYSNIPSVEPDLRSHMLSHARYGVMRTGWKKDDRFLLFDSAPWGGNHCHNDRLQVVLYSGRDLLVDPGILTYDSPLTHRYFKKSAAHNVVLVDEGEQPLKGNPELLTWSIQEHVEFASARIRGKDDIAHQRSVLFVKPNYWVILDYIAGSGEHTTTRLFHFPDVEVVKEGNSASSQYPDGDNLYITSVGDGALEIRQGHKPNGLTTTTRTPVAAFVSHHRLPVLHATLLFPFTSRDEIPRVEHVATESKDMLAIQLIYRGNRKDTVLIATSEQDLRFGEYKGKGTALVVREEDDQSAVHLVEPSP
jgi:hypothetical protein